MSKYCRACETGDETPHTCEYEESLEKRITELESKLSEADELGFVKTQRIVKLQAKLDKLQSALDSYKAPKAG